MAVGVLAAAPEFTRQVYDDITEKMVGHSPMRADEAPEGLILHSAGQGEQGFYVYDVWESREAFERLYAPMGLDIGAISPEEIAIAVAAEMIAVRRGAVSNWRALAMSVFTEARRGVLAK